MGGLGGLGSLLFVNVSDGECGKSLHESSSVVGSRGVRESEHSLCEFSVELGLGVGEGRFDVDKFLKVVEVSVHLNNLGSLTHVFLGSVLKLHSRGRGSKLVGSRSPFDAGSRVEQVAWGEVSDTILLDATDTEGLLVFLVEGGREDFNDHIGISLLGVNVGIEVRLAGFDGGHDRFEGVTTLFHVTLDLPVELDIIGDIKVEGEVNKVTDTFVMERVKTFEDDDGGRFDLLRSVKSSVDVVVDGLHDGLSVLEGIDLLVHEVEVVLKRVQCGKSGFFASVTVIKMEIIEADDGGKVRDQGVCFPAILGIETSSKRSNNISSEDACKTTHEGRLSATGVSGNTDDNGLDTVGKSHVQAAGRRNSHVALGHESRRSEGGGGASGKSSDRKGELHFDTIISRLIKIMRVSLVAVDNR